MFGFYLRKMGNDALTEKLQNSETPVEKILEESDLTQDLPLVPNQALSYFTKEKVSNLIDYITNEPKENDSEFAKHRFPFTACEVLSSDINKINDYFSLNNEELYSSSRKNSTFSEKESEDKKEDDDEDEEENVKIIEQKEGEKKEEETEKKTPSEEEKEKEVPKEEKAPKEEETPKEVEEPKKEEEVEIPKEEEKPIVNPTNIDLLDKLLNFLNTKSQLNDVLSGYFSKVMIHLLTKYPFKILTYLYKYRTDAISNMVYHSYQVGISEICVKVLSLEIYMINSNVTDSMKPIQDEYQKALIPRNKILIELIDSIKVSETDDISCKISLCQSLFESQKILEFIISNEEFCTKMFSKISKDVDYDSNSNLRYNFSLYLDLLSSIIKNCNNFSVGLPSLENDVLTHSAFSKRLIDNLEIILKNFKESKTTQKIKSSFNVDVKPLGALNMKIIELVIQLFSFMKVIPKSLDELLIKTNFIATSVDFLFKYEWNNLYQQNFINMFKQFMNDEQLHPLLSHYLFHEKQFTSLLISQVQLDRQFKFPNSKKEISVGYFSILIYLCYKINAVGGGQSVNIRSREGSFYFTASSSMDYQSNSNAFKIYDLNKNIGNKKSGAINISGEIKSCLNEDWVYIFKQQVMPLIKLYEMRLFDDSSALEDDEEIISEDNYGTPEGKTEDSPFNGGSNIPSKEGSGTFFKEIENDMEKTENEKELTEEVNMKVDEIDLKNYNDLMFWKESDKKLYLNDEKLVEDAMKDLGLE